MAIVKGVGGVAAVGTLSGGGFYLHHSGLLDSIFGSNTDKAIYLVTQISETTNQSSAALYNSETKNYHCQFADGTEQYDCDILDEITTAKDKKWINFGSINSKTKTNEKLLKDKLVKDSYFSLKVEAKLEEKIKSSESSEIKIIPKIKVANEDNKIFGKFKIIATKKGDKPIGSFQQFLGKASSVENSNASGTEKKCQFSNDDEPKSGDLKTCSLQIFADTQSNASKTSNYDGLTYKGSESNLTTVPVENNHYIIKFSNESDKFSDEQFSDKKLIYFEHLTSGDNTNKKKVIFTPFKPVTVHSETTGSQKIW